MTALGATIDRSLNAGLARLTGGLSPAGLAEAWFDWALHLSGSPGKQIALVDKALRKSLKLVDFMLRSASNPDAELCIQPLPQDRRFADPAWRRLPFSFYFQAFQLQQQWWHNATNDVAGVSSHHQEMVAFAARQLLDMAAPSNYVTTNPIVLKATLESSGENLHAGLQNLYEDWSRLVAGKPPVGAEDFVVGRDVATTPGEVILRNELIELIQYAPTTPTVAAEPLLIVPAWIMKYYVLDLSMTHSLVRHLVGSGFTVFMISWNNPDGGDANRGIADYLRLGLAAALDAIDTVAPGERVHAAGYCLGGTLLAIGAAAMARDGDERLASLTLIASQVDFTEAGELTLFIDEAQVRFLEDVMSIEGVLEARQMAGAFQMLRSNDLIWSRVVRDYLLGERTPMTDISAWNADATRMPARMHGEYLRGLFLQNDLAEGRFTVDGRPIALGDIRTPIFALGTERDHVAPWRSVYKINLLTDTEVTFALVSGGHNRGVVSAPGQDKGVYARIGTATREDPYRDPDDWRSSHEARDGSWWPLWSDWMKTHSSGHAAARAPRESLAPAPGAYVLER
ncbi:poly-beta-hydroxybutyrate polymerase domain-containing protein [Methylopila sp. Yamaguchi]|uniref:PHA/PHB synthase family protein n=1 Tax=Methylopila sp. Yamaguchi TaxID=1437817 RepID=UPI000CC8FEF9|nr:alpha/beta fold hydrolase [Methylopila sp. Yamaguchi]GBD47807.1 poly-beta-hydroxybutyrate polymerase domain-containing protein [Methylopila sp. Yamaguchi]